MTVTFFGHRDTPDIIRPRLEKAIYGIIGAHPDAHFLVGDIGAFDRMVQGVLVNVKKEQPDISCHIAIAYLDGKEHTLPTVFPEGIENVPKRFAIDFRNNYMLECADTLICYVHNVAGGARKFYEKALKQGKTVINLAD